MVLMALSSRNSEVAFRDQFSTFLIEQKGYPKGLITKEMPLSFLEQAKGHRRDRRVDLLVFATGSASPLLLIECKKNIPQQKAVHQLLGYNLHVRAPWCALVWPEGFALLDLGGHKVAGLVTEFPEYKSFLNF